MDDKAVNVCCIHQDCQFSYWKAEQEKQLMLCSKIVNIIFPEICQLQH